MPACETRGARSRPVVVVEKAADADEEGTEQRQPRERAQQRAEEARLRAQRRRGGEEADVVVEEEGEEAERRAARGGVAGRERLPGVERHCAGRAARLGLVVPLAHGDEAGAERPRRLLADDRDGERHGERLGEGERRERRPRPVLLPVAHRAKHCEWDAEREHRYVRFRDGRRPERKGNAWPVLIPAHVPHGLQRG